MPLNAFHPAVRAWFQSRFSAATPVQSQAWPAILSGGATLIAAPTGSGKTLAAFLCSINELIIRGLEQGLPDLAVVLYISPLKALSNDIQKNLQLPLNGIRDKLLESCRPDVAIRAWVRTGDSTPGERQRMLRTPPHIIVTTPESLSILLTSDSGRRLLKSIETVIVDEIHALAGNKRGAHLSLSLQRLESLCQRKLRRIGLSATQKPIQDIAHFLVGGGDCQIVDTGHQRHWDISLELPQSPLEAIMANEVWSEQYSRLVELIESHRTTLIFVNTRRLAERVAHNLAQKLGDENAVTAHHGSLSREHRLGAEQRLKQGQLRALVATASLELGIDIGDIDLVCQIGSPRAINAFLQRVGRSGHSVGGLSKGRLFPLSRDDLVECAALLASVQQGQLDEITLVGPALDVLAQHIVAEVSAREWPVAELFDWVRGAYPYRALDYPKFQQVLCMLAEGYSTRRGRRSAYIHYDKVNQILRARRGARLTAVMNCGAIPDQFDYDVILEPEGLFVGSLNEDFAFESLPGDIFQLGNTAYRIRKIEHGKVMVEDAHGQPPNIPFWFGEAPGRSDALSQAVSHFRAELAAMLRVDPTKARSWLTTRLQIPTAASEQLCDYISLAQACFQTLPSRRHIIFERFFDETGDMHFVIHSPLGSRINRAWGLALRKRFCRKFNFELQAAADDDHIILSLGPTHSFPLAEVKHYLKSPTVKDILIQAVLDAPVFATRWRWNCNISLAVPRIRNGKRVPAQFQRNDAEDLVAVVFPDQLACLENIKGNREIPDHPLVEQTLADCLQDNMDITGLERLLKDIETGTVTIACFDLAAPSPLAEAIIHARPYAFLDDAPAEERRTLAIKQQSVFHVEDAALLSIISPQAILQVKQEAWPSVQNAEELHDALVVMAYLTEREIQLAVAEDLPSSGGTWTPFLTPLLQQQRICAFPVGTTSRLWVAAEHLEMFFCIYGEAVHEPKINGLAAEPKTAYAKTPLTHEQALVEIIRSRLEGLGPIQPLRFASELGLPLDEILQALLALEQEGFVLRGQFQPPSATSSEQWCERRLLARIHRYSRDQRRRQSNPIASAGFMRFLFEWQGLTQPSCSPPALFHCLQQLEGLSLPAAAWESVVLPQRISHYSPADLDLLCVTGRITWLRLPDSKDRSGKSAAKNPVGMTPIALIPRNGLPYWQLSNDQTDLTAPLSATAASLVTLLQQRGALFFQDLVKHSGLLRSQVENALAEIVARGRVSADHFTGLRALITANKRKPRFGFAPGHPRSIEDAGRWWLLDTQGAQASEIQVTRDDYLARCLLRRYGIVFRKLLDREVGLPSWRELLYVLRRMEDRGEIRGGRFVQGFAGEQFALPEAVGSLNRFQNEALDDDILILAAADPLNLTGIITPGDRIPGLLKTRIIYSAGSPVAVIQNAELRFLKLLPTELAAKIQAKAQPSYKISLKV